MKLIRPDEKYLSSYREACLESVKHCPNDEKAFDDSVNIIQKSIDYENGVNMRPGYVRATTLWLIDDEQFVGMINVRHELTEYLLNYGGHIGYEIRYTKRNKGYGTKMLSMVLPYCKESLKLKKVLITCDEDNIGSARVIEKNGGVLENVVINYIEKRVVKTKRYWIDLGV